MRKVILFISVFIVLLSSCASDDVNKNSDEKKSLADFSEQLPELSDDTFFKQEITQELVDQILEDIDEPFVRDLDLTDEQIEELKKKAEANGITVKTQNDTQFPAKKETVKPQVETSTSVNNPASSSVQNKKTETKKTSETVPAAKNETVPAKNKSNNENTKTQTETGVKQPSLPASTAKQNETKNDGIPSPTSLSSNTKTEDKKNQNNSSGTGSSKTTGNTTNTSNKNTAVPETKTSSPSANTANASSKKAAEPAKTQTKPVPNAEYPGFVKDDVEPKSEEINYKKDVESPDGIIPSRTIALKKGETLIVVYPGSGWVYLGSLSEYNNLESRGRKVGDTETTYTLYAKEPGTQIHHFYKTDNLTGKYIDDYLEVTVINIKGSSSTQIRAPDYSAMVPNRPDRPALSSDTIKNKELIVSQEEWSKEGNNLENLYTGEMPSEERDSIQIFAERTDDEKQFFEDNSGSIPTSETDYHNYAADDLIEIAKKLYNEKKYDESYKVLNIFFSVATDRLDEGLFLKGKLFETDCSLKDIKKSIASYEELTEDYPMSSLWDDANKRIIYLKRFYIDIR